MTITDYKYAYFLGIGGIGMSAIARYLNSRGVKVYGYDKTPTDLTAELSGEGIGITFDDSVDTIPEVVKSKSDETLLIYTPAIPKDHVQYNWFLSQNRQPYKRSEVLGMISRGSFCIAVAGTHGKTTTSSMIAHLLHSCNINFTAFLGGISSNFNSNYFQHSTGISIWHDKDVVVLEADEFDRSFHRLDPDIAVITAMDPDHLDIYGTADAFYEAFEIFASKIKPGGFLVINDKLDTEWEGPYHQMTYALGEGHIVNFHSTFTGIQSGYFEFDFHGDLMDPDESLSKYITGARCGLPGFHNIENATAAAGVVLMLMDQNEASVAHGLETFKGVKRRFEYIVRTENTVVIDDYAHHPGELDAIIGSVRELYPGKTISGIFQPHLFTRTRDFADGFAKSLSQLDELILMDIYPARELPIPGITSAWLLEQVQNTNKQLLSENEILQWYQQRKPEVLLILGAGDIDRLVPKIKATHDGN